MTVGGFSFYYGKKFIVCVYGMGVMKQDNEKDSLRSMLKDLDRENIYGEKEERN